MFVLWQFFLIRKIKGEIKINGFKYPFGEAHMHRPVHLTGPNNVLIVQIFRQVLLQDASAF